MTQPPPPTPPPHTRHPPHPRTTPKHPPQSLTAAIATGTLTIAGIGFTGSYTALQQLATRNGFGTFSYFLPLGIDAGICVLLALDLLLTWTRIPYPLLRPTAWLLTAATIAFNAAAAWPDPLAVAMHAVIPILFIVTVEAARHATGRIADITADTHMEGVRLTRWLLSPLPTFLLWRRMKLWELRSYNHAINLEQERLIYQTRLRTHYGRNWRHKAPAESLMPLHLTRYGIPLTPPTPTDQTTTNTPTPAARFTPWQTTQPAQDHRRRPRHRQQHQPPQHDAPSTARPSKQPAVVPTHHTPHSTDTATADRLKVHNTINPPPALTQAQPRTAPDQSHRQQQDQQTTPTPTTDRRSAAHPQTRPPHQPPDPQQTSPAEKPDEAALTTVDRYYLAWLQYRQHHSAEPTAEQLAHHLTQNGIHTRQGKPITPSTLRRYTLSFRLYTIWAQHRTHTHHPNPHTVAHHCNTHNITAQYNKPITPHHITHHTPDFQRRFNTLHPPPTPPSHDPPPDHEAR